MKLYKLCVIAIIFAETLVFAKESLYEVDGAKVRNKVYVTERQWDCVRSSKDCNTL